MDELGATVCYFTLSKKLLGLDKLKIVNKPQESDRIGALIDKTTAGYDDELEPIGIINFEYYDVSSLLKSDGDLFLETIETNIIITKKDIIKKMLPKNLKKGICIIEIKENGMEWSSVYEEFDLAGYKMPTAVLYNNNIPTLLRYNILHK